MRLHPQVTDKILYLCTNYGGHKDERRLVAALEQIRLSMYQADKLGLCLVDTQQYVNECYARKLPTQNIVPMKLHNSVVQKLLYAYNMYSGHSNETKLRSALSTLDLTPYERKGAPEVVLVLSSDYMKTLQGTTSQE